MLALLPLAGEVHGASDPLSRLFGTEEIRSSNLEPFPMWTGVLDRYFDERSLLGLPCESSTFNRCHLQEWKRFLASIENLEPMAQLVLVNARMNTKRYITDPRNYGLRDYWATPLQFFNKDGDCEDYAITKFMSLRALGFENDHMRIVVLNDLNLRIPHAVLVVYMKGRALVLDNQIQLVVPAEAVRHYSPIYSVNESNWWLHRR